MPYADADDYTTYTGQPPPDGVTVLLDKATRLVDTVLIGAVYPVDDDGQPTDDAVIAALRDATCAQVEWFDETGDTTGAAELYQSASIGNVQFSRGYTGRGSATGPSQRVAPDVLNILRVAGLLPITAQVLG